MLYKVNEIFTSIKGEGVWLGTPMNFVRLANCNLACDHCDTSYDEPVMEMEIGKIVAELYPNVRYVVLTGGEPTMQDLTKLINALQVLGYQVHLESNGTNPIIDTINWICVSPKLRYKDPLPENVAKAHEIKMPIMDADDLNEAELFRAGYEARLAREGMDDTDKVWFLLPWNDNFEQYKHGKKLGAGSRTVAGFNPVSNKICIEHAIKTGNKWRIAIQAHKTWSIR